MPFTFSHPALILPLTYLPKQWVSLTGLVIGSVTPDFEYFLRMKMKSNFSHTIDGLFWFDLPLGILLALIFHNIVRDKLFDNLPSFLRTRLAAFKKFNWNEHFKRNWFVVTISILLGAATHIFWDGFTHEHGYFTAVFPGLTDHISLFGGLVPIFKILQHSSTIVGGLIVIFAIYKLPVSQTEADYRDLKYLLIVVGITVAVITIKYLYGLELNQYGNVIVTVISAGLLSLIIAPLLIGKDINHVR